MSVFELHRTNICGAIKDDTPGCVILEIASCLSITIDWSRSTTTKHLDEMINTIPSAKIETIHEEKFFPEKDQKEHGFYVNQLQLIARFVNGDDTVNWKIKPLINAFRHLCKYYKSDRPPLPLSPQSSNGGDSGDFIIGQKTMITPLAYNACMLYRLCVYHGIRTTRTTTIEQMGQAVKELNRSTDDLRDKIIDVIRSSPRVSLINLTIMCPDLRFASSPSIRQSKDKSVESPPSASAIPPLPLPQLPSSESKVSSPDSHISMSKTEYSLPDIEYFNHKQLEHAYTVLTDPKQAITRVNPLCQEEAIMLAAIIYGINITECRNPHKEYLAIKDASLSGAVENRYIPVHDKAFRLRYLTNPCWFDTRKTWTAKLSSIYTSDNLMNFAIAEGYTQDDIKARNSHELLSESRLFPTFYLGRHPDCKASRTLIELEDVTAINPHLIVTYGISEGGPLTIFKITELLEAFKSNKIFCNPIKTSEMISDIAINKLRIIAKDKIGKSRKQLPVSRRFYSTNRGAETEVEAIYQQLIAVMDIIEKSNIANSKAAKKLSCYHREYNMLPFLNSLLHMAYYMRGWKVGKNEEPPISNDATQFPLDLQGQVDLNVSASIYKFEKTIDSMPREIRDFIKTLPLIEAKSLRSEVAFQPSANPDQGITILNRVAIVKAGSSVYSCIRMSSNWFAASAYYYMIGCRLAPPFDIHNLSSIS